MFIGEMCSKVSVQKLNTKSSMKAEIVGVSEYLPCNTWITNFISTHGYKIKNNIFYQDNHSGIGMEKNGINTCTGNARHINTQ